MKSSLAFKKLSEIKPIVLDKSYLSDLSKQKIKDTALYSLEKNPDEDLKYVVERCMIAQLAEQYVAEHMEGWINFGQEDENNPLTFAYDVLSNIKYSGARIEVKTHQSKTKYVLVNTMHKPPYKGDAGLNILPFLNYPISDLMIIFHIEKLDNEWKLIPFMFGDRESFSSNLIIKHSKYNGYFVNTMANDEAKQFLNVHYF